MEGKGLISVIACTNRQEWIPHLIANFQKQTLAEKELVLILHSLLIKWNQIQQHLDDLKINCRVLQFPEKMSLGECLNKGVAQAKYEWAAKMDDDDYYGTGYLAEAMEALVQTKADVVGKSTFYIYFKGRQEIRLYNPGWEHRWIINSGGDTYQASFFLSGAAMVFKKAMFEKISFPHVNKGEDSGFQQLCFEHKIKMLSLSRDHYIYVRYGEAHHHSSDATDRVLRERSRFIGHTHNLEAFFDKKTT